MKVDKLHRLFQALDGKAPARTASIEQQAAERAQKTGDAASIQFSSQARQNRTEGGDPAARAARVEELKQLHQAGELRPADSNKLAEKLLVELF